MERRRKKANAGKKRAKRKISRSPLAVGTYIVERSPTPAQLERHFKSAMHPLRARIYDARHKLGFSIDWNPAEGRYVGKPPQAKKA